jgi:adenine-specific DNA methylase
MQYLGSKARISGWILDQVEKRFPESETFVDLFAGTGSVSLAARERRYRLVLNDLQPYA